MHRLSFNSKIIGLVKACISSASFSVLVNNQPSDPFVSQRGVRQGCPLFSYLFVMAINELSSALQEGLSSNHLSGISLGPNCPPIHSLLFADDLIICGKANLSEAMNIRTILDSFCQNSGQAPNWNKSSILFNKRVD
jgi:hypothetical protein